MQKSVKTDEIMTKISDLVRWASSISFEGVSKSELALLAAISDMEARNLRTTVALIAKELSISPPAVSRMLKKLEINGIVTKKVDLKCLRNVNIFLTDKGRKILDENIGRCRKRVDKLMSIYTREEIEALDRIGEKFMAFVKSGALE